MTIPNPFYNYLTSPIISIFAGYTYISILAIIFYIKGYYTQSDFFSWGTPVTFMGLDIKDDETYYMLLTAIFIHQLINNWVNEVTYPWIINCIQDPKSRNIIYSRSKTMIIINLFALYSELDIILLIAGVMSQISFFVVIIIANFISVSIINWQYIKDKHYSEINEYLT